MLEEGLKIKKHLLLLILLLLVGCTAENIKVEPAEEESMVIDQLPSNVVEEQLPPEEPVILDSEEKIVEQLDKLLQ